MSEDKSSGLYLGGGEPGFVALIADESNGNGLVWRVVGGVYCTLKELGVYVLNRNELFRATEDADKAVVTGPRDVLVAYRVFPHIVLKAALGDGSFKEIEVD